MQKVFVVEDSAPVRERLLRLLETIPGVKVIGEASDVEEAIGAILEGKPDVVLLDLALEHGSGFDVLRAVHGTEPGIDFYMLSNFASEPYQRYAQRLGACGFFDKSKDFARLRELIARRGPGHR
jgi:DNA-binding NarL/FixJ family response regulator